LLESTERLKMSRSISIIKHLIDENLIDAKQETESYLNDILSDSLRSEYGNVAPSMFEEEHDKKGKGKSKGKHDCAKHVMKEGWGEGVCIHGQHATPDENGFVEWYDVKFNHGIERRVPVNEMHVLVSEEHHDH
jgi:hypothetical protein